MKRDARLFEHRVLDSGRPRITFRRSSSEELLITCSSRSVAACSLARRAARAAAARACSEKSVAARIEVSVFIGDAPVGKEMTLCPARGEAVPVADSLCV